MLLGKLKVGVDLGSTSIKIAGIRKKGEGHRLEFYDVVDLTQEYAMQSYDEVNDYMYIEQLKNLVSEYHLKDAPIYITLPSNTAVVHGLSLDVSDPDLDMAETIQDKLSEAAAGNLDEMQIVCQQVEDVGNQGSLLPMLACAVPNDVLTRYVTIIKECGLKTAVVDLDALGVYNAFYFFCNKKIAFPITVVHIGSQYTICAIVLPGKLPFFKIVPLGGKDITERIMQEFNFSLSQAETFKSRFFQPKWASRQSYQKTQLNDLITHFSEQLVAEVKKCLRHFQTFEGVGADGVIYLTGGGAKLEILSRLFSKELHITTEIWNPLKFFVKTRPDQDDSVRRQKGIYLTPAIGTLLRGD